jgi:hypothetical protein
MPAMLVSRPSFLLVMLLGAWSAAAHGQEVSTPEPTPAAVSAEVVVGVDRDDVTIGDIVHYTEEITYDANLTLNLSPMGTNLGNFVIRDYDTSEITLEDGRRRRLREYTLATYFLGERPIPPLQVGYTTPDGTTGTVSASPLTVQVRSVASGEDEGLRGPKPVRSIPADHGPLYRLLGAIALGLTLVGLLVWLIWKGYLGRRADQAEETRPPHEVALERLQKLRGREVPDRAAMKALYFELTEILRWYLGKVFACPLLERTTAEIAEELRHTDLAEEHYHLVMEVLADADIVKFADYLPPDEERVGHLKTSEQVIWETRPLPPDPLSAVKGVEPGTEKAVTEIEPVEVSSAGEAEKQEKK